MSDRIIAERLYIIYYFIENKFICNSSRGGEDVSAGWNDSHGMFDYGNDFEQVNTFLQIRQATQ